MDQNKARLTSFAHGGGCGCKLSPSVLRSLLANQPTFGTFKDLLVGTESSDDAAVYRIEGDTCVIATTDFFMPVVDDPRDFGRIAATNAISDVYAMGGKPILALAILGMPLGKIDPAIVSQILAGGAEICGEAGIPVAGGHSIDCPEPIYGLAVVGTCKVENIRKNSTAVAGDVLILTKSIGVGVYSAALKKGVLTPEQYNEMVASTTQLNKVGVLLGQIPEVHAVTDVTGFGVLGHSVEMAVGSAATLKISSSAVPLLVSAKELAQNDYVTGASDRNWNSYSDKVELYAGLAEWERDLLTDPQTSGGLLVSVSREKADQVLEQIIASGCATARVIGEVVAGDGKVVVVA